MNTPHSAASRSVIGSVVQAALLLLSVLAATCCGAQDTVSWGEGFESPVIFDNWIISAGTWEIGTPAGAKGGGKAYAGSKCAVTKLSGPYSDDVDSRLISPSFTVPAAEAQPRLRFWHWYAFASGDAGTVELQVAGGTWQTISPVYTKSSGDVWTRALIELGAYAGQTVQLAFHFRSNSDFETSYGWFVDELSVEEGALIPFSNPEGFESGLGAWLVDKGTWEIGTPDRFKGPGKAYAGSKCAVTKDEPTES